MPYILQKSREPLEQHIVDTVGEILIGTIFSVARETDNLSAELKEQPIGAYNYVISKVIFECLEEINYSKLNTAIGTLTIVQGYITNETARLHARMDVDKSQAACLESFIKTLCYNMLDKFPVRDVIGCLECAKLELYRRVVAPYENRALKRNGDVYAKD